MQPFKYLRLKIDQLLQRRIVRDTLWLLVGKGMRLVLQAAYFIIIARTLGVANYGAFVGMTALVAIVSPFVGCGIDTLLLKNVAKDRNLFSKYWGNALLMVLVTGFGLMMLLAVIKPIALPSISPRLIALVALSDLIFGSITNIAIRAFQAVDRLNISAQINIFIMFAKVVAACALMFFFSTPTLVEWTWLYLASSIAAALLAVTLVYYSLGAPKLALERILPELKEGFYFSISTSAYTVYNDIDKTMLARLSTLEATGIYAAAYRLIDVAFIPVISIAGAAYADFFRKGKDGVTATVAFAKPLVITTSVYSICAGIGLILFAPIVPYILGGEYTNVVEALKWLAPIPLFRGLQHFGGDILSGTGNQGLRSALEVIISIFNITINLWLIPLYSWQGAAWSSLASDGLLMLMLWSAVTYLHTKQNSKFSN